MSRNPGHPKPLISRAGAPLSGGQAQPLLSIAQVADRLGLSPKTVRRRIVDDDLQVHRLGRSLRISEADLRAYLERSR